MPDFIFTSPDGQKHKVTGPEGSTPEQAFGILQNSLGGGKPVAPPEPKKPTSSSFMDFIKSIPGGVVGGLAGTASASGQAELGQMTGGATDNLSNLVTGQKGGVPGKEEGTRLLEENVFGAQHQPETGAGKVGAAIGEAIGTPTTYLGPMAKGVGVVGDIAGKAITGALGAAGGEIAGQMTNENPLARFLGGAAGGAVGPGMVKGAAKDIDPARQAAVKALEKMGVKPSAGDVTGSPGVREAERLGDVLGGAESYKKVKEEPLRQYTARALEKMGEKPAPGELATPDVISRAHDRIGNVMEQSAKKLPVHMDQKFVDAADGLEKEVTRLRLPEAQQFSGLLDEITNGFVTGPTGVPIMDGKTYQGLTRYGTPLSNAIHSNNPNLSHYASKLREALDDALERSAHRKGTRTGYGSRKALADLKEARKQWYNMLVVSKSVAGAGEEASAGLVLPNKLQSNVAAGADNKLNYAAGKGDLHDLARAGSRILSPYSGTRPEARWAMRGAMGAAGGIVGSMATGNPVTGGAIGMAASAAAPGFIGRAVNSPAGQWFLKKQHEARGKLAPAAKRVPGVGLSGLRGGAIGASQAKEPRPSIYEE